LGFFRGITSERKLSRAARWIAASIGAMALVAIVAWWLVWWLNPTSTLEAPAPFVIADVASERLTTLGPVVGSAGPHDTHVWLGVPFAAPPIGPLRWSPPVRHDTWTDTFDALEWGSPCVQLANRLGGVGHEAEGTLVGSEDCLTLNVWTPRFDPGNVPTGRNRLPVVVWIHGGGNIAGFAGPMYDGALLADRHDLVVVALQYRLGPFGWFAHPAVLDGGPEGGPRSGNFGTLDLIAGLTWVQENIEAFGGDPEAVTIFGESAGGTNVVSLMLSPLAKGLFRGAIVQSGSTASTSLAQAVHYADDDEPGHPASAREVVLRLLIQEGAASDRENARLFAEGLSSTQLAEYLRGKSPEEIMQAVRDDDAASSIWLPRVIRDGVALPLDPALEVLRDRSRYNAVPMILGSNRDEIKLFFSQDPEFVNRYLKVFVRLRDPERYDLLARFHSDLWKANGVDVPATVLSEAGLGDVYAYRFDWDEEPVFLGADLGAILGAGHGLEIPFVFGHFRFGDEQISKVLFGPQNLAGRQYVSDAMMSYWAEFAYTGHPGRGRDGSLPEWKTWRTGGADSGFIVFDTPEGGGIRMSDDRVSPQSVIAAVDAEETLARNDKCQVYFNLFRHSDGWSVDAFRQMGREGCRDFPIDQAGAAVSID
jgi:para-nitrobenzyl esterase